MPVTHNQDNTMDYLLMQTKETFRAFVDTIIPRSPELAKEYGEIQYYGASDLKVDEYLIITLNQIHPLLPIATADMLNAAAQKLVSRFENKEPVDLSAVGLFSALAPDDRLLALMLLKKYQYNFSHLLFPFENISYNITDNLIRLTMMGYYSEWYGYGSTRLDKPNERVLEFYPLSWNQVEYPGPTPERMLKQSQSPKEIRI